jgi:hypothetical protein
MDNLSFTAGVSGVSSSTITPLEGAKMDAVLAEDIRGMDEYPFPRFQAS